MNQRMINFAATGITYGPQNIFYEDTGDILMGECLLSPSSNDEHSNLEKFNAWILMPMKLSVAYPT